MYKVDVSLALLRESPEGESGSAGWRLRQDCNSACSSQPAGRQDKGFGEVAASSSQGSQGEKKNSEDAPLKVFSPYWATLEKHRRAVPKGKEIRS